MTSSLRKEALFSAGSTVDAEISPILERLASRASCRDFDGSTIDRDLLEEIIRDGVEAPSSCNQQNWHFVLIDDPEQKRRARDISGGNHHFAECSALIFLCFQKGWTHGNFSIVQSVAGACYHMMLSAHLRGFQCIWNAGIGDHDQLRDLLKLPQTFELQGALAIGRAKPTAPDMKAPRRPVEEIFSWDRFDRSAPSVYPAKPAEAYPFWEIRNDSNPFAEWDPARWRWDQIADFRGYSVWAKSPLAGVYVSRRQGDALAAEHGLLPEVSPGSRVVEVMPWGGTTTTSLLKKLGGEVDLSIAELSPNNHIFIKERLRREGHTLARVSFDLMPEGRLPYSGGAIDLVVLPQILEHVPNPELLLDEAVRILAPGGHIVLSTRNAASAYGALWRNVESKAQIPNQGPFTPLPAETVRRWVSERFTIEEDIGIGREATGDAVIMTGSERFSGRLYALRGRRD